MAGRKKGFDMNKVRIIVDTLAKNPSGLWIRELSRACGLPLSTTSYYVNNVIFPLLDDARIGGEKSIIRVVRLKDSVLSRLRSGEDVSSIMKYVRVFKKIYSGG